MLMTEGDKYAARRARVIAEGIRDVAAELRLIDLADFISFIRLEQFANIQDIVNSSIELYFKHGTLTYACAADFQLEWDASPAVLIGMEFSHRQVVASFNLTLRPAVASVELHSISFGGEMKDGETEIVELMAAIEDAKIPHASH
jgi:hypothetical protein